MSCDLPENLQVIKSEPTSPTTSEDKPPHNIKAKLNLHVKRRLQYFSGQNNQNDSEYLHEHFTDGKPQSRNKVTIKLDQNSFQTNKEQLRQKRPYQKRTYKSKSAVAPSGLQQLSTEATTSTQRKHKPKLKPLSATGNPDTLTPISQDDSSSHATMSLNVGGVSGGEEDEAGGHDDMRPGREKAKCPDVLSMVLSMKKRALLQDPEVQQFLSKVMQVIKA